MAARISLLFVLLIGLSVGVFGKDQAWQEAQVVQVAGQLPQRGFYWLRASDKTYLISNHAKGSVLLTLGGTVRVYTDGKNLHLIDDANKERKCQILRSMSNAMADIIAERQAKKTPQQLAEEQQFSDSLALQNAAAANAMRLQRQAQIAEELRQLNPPSPPVQPLPTSQTNIHCTSQIVGETTYTNCH